MEATVYFNSDPRLIPWGEIIFEMKVIVADIYKSSAVYHYSIDYSDGSSSRVETGYLDLGSSHPDWIFHERIRADREKTERGVEPVRLRLISYGPYSEDVRTILGSGGSPSNSGYKPSSGTSSSKASSGSESPVRGENKGGCLKTLVWVVVIIVAIFLFIGFVTGFQ